MGFMLFSACQKEPPPLGQMPSRVSFQLELKLKASTNGFQKNCFNEIELIHLYSGQRRRVIDTVSETAAKYYRETHS